MGFESVEHELHARRKNRNLAVAGCLVALMVLMVGLTLVKIRGGGSLEAFDHSPRITLTEDGS